jgi:membrane dipeptidase
LNPEGLSALGKAVVQRMIELGIVIDVSHASDKSLEDVLAITEPLGVPILVSHTGARALLNTERNLSDALAKRIAQSGGLIAVSAFAKQLETPPEYFISPQHQPGTCDDLVAHWKHLADVVGFDGVVFGSDMNGFIVRPQAGGLCANGIRNMGDLPQVWAALKQRGISEQSLSSMGERLLKLIEAVEHQANPSEQQRALRDSAGVLRPRSALDSPGP